MSKKKANFLFLYPDQWRFDWLESNKGVPVRTPNIRKLQERGVNFSKAITPSPLCAPARAALACGKEYDNCRVKSNRVDYPLDQETFYTMLKDDGYAVLGCGKFDLHKNSYIWGEDGKTLIHDWGFTDGIDNEGKWDCIISSKDGAKGPYATFLAEEGLLDAHHQDMEQRRVKNAVHSTSLPESAYCDNWLAQNGLDLLAQVPVGTPWFIQVNFTGPHDPWDITEKMAALYPDEAFPAATDHDTFSADEINAIRQNYAAMCENIDRQIGRYLDAVEERGELANTYVIFTSDHGEMLGDHNGWGKGTPYHSSLSVPMVIAGPEVRRNVNIDLPMTNLDVTATILDCADLPIPDDMESRSLRPLLEGHAETHRDHVIAGLHRWRTVYDGRYKLTEMLPEDGEPAYHLYDLLEDPEELNDIFEPESDRCRSLIARLPERKL